MVQLTEICLDLKITKDFGIFGIGLLVGGGFSYYILKKEIDNTNRIIIKRCKSVNGFGIKPHIEKVDDSEVNWKKSSLESFSGSEQVDSKEISLSQIPSNLSIGNDDTRSPLQSDHPSSQVERKTVVQLAPRKKLGDLKANTKKPTTEAPTKLLNVLEPIKTRKSTDKEHMQFFEQMEVLLDDSNQTERHRAYEILKKQKDNREMTQNSDYFHLLSRAAFYEAQKISDKAKSKSIYEKAKYFSDVAVKLNPSNGKALKWAAITIGALADRSSFTVGLGLVNSFVEYCFKAYKYEPNDAILNHMIGRYNYQIADLPWTKKVALNKISPNTKGASYEHAINYLKKSEELQPGVTRDNNLFIAKSYIGLKKIPEALKYLHKAEKMKLIHVGETDVTSMAEVKKLLKEYSVKK